MYKTGRYENDKTDGEWKGYYPSGKTESIYNFNLGKMTGLSRAWYENGNLKDSFNLDKGGNGYGLGYYEDGQKRYEGNFADGIKKGQWKYYYDVPGSHQSMLCEFANDSLMSSKCFTKEGEQQNKDCNFEKEAEFKGGHEAWVKYLVKKIDKSKYLNYMKVGMHYTVIVKFALDEEGTVTDVEVEDPGSSERLDNIAEDIIRQSPHWEPAIQYNQTVKAYRRQPITFIAQAQ
jgi:TonB family protein